MSTTGWLALVDGVSGALLLVSAARQRRNKGAVIAVAAVLLGISGWLAVLAVDGGPTKRAPVPAKVKETDDQTSAGAGGHSGGVGISVARP